MGTSMRRREFITLLGGWLQLSHDREGAWPHIPQTLLATANLIE
jgi:hypothetical protein